MDADGRVIMPTRSRLMSHISYLRKKKGEISNVVIVYPFTYKNPYYVLPPIAAEYLQAGVIEAGRDAVLLDMRYETDIKGHLEKADLVCLYGYFEDCSIFGKWNIHVIADVLTGVPEGTPVAAGGTGFKDYENALNAHPKIDVIIRGNPEIPIMELLEKGSPEDVNNLVYRAAGKAVYTERVVNRLTDDIYPRRRRRNPGYKYHMMGIKADLIRAGVGCDYRCKFCFEYGKDFDGTFMGWQGRSAQSLFNEIKETDAALIGWVDDDMTADMDTLSELSDLLLKNKVRKLYGGTGRIDHVVKKSVEDLKKMERAGFFALSFGVESLKPETLKFYGKGQTAEGIEKAMRMMSETNIILICNFILGSPGETEKDMMDMLWFGRRWNVDSLVTNRLRVQKDSPMFKAIHDEKGRVRAGYERIEGEALSRIKFRIKFGQRTPLRILLTLLKLYRHEGMFIDPLYLFLSAVETFTKHTWLEKTAVLPAVIKIMKRLLISALTRQFFRTIAVIVTPFIKGINWAFELIDRRIGASTTILPKVFEYLDRKVYKKQRRYAQLEKKST